MIKILKNDEDDERERERAYYNNNNKNVNFLLVVFFPSFLFPL